MLHGADDVVEMLLKDAELTKHWHRYLEDPEVNSADRFFASQLNEKISALSTAKDH